MNFCVFLFVFTQMTTWEECLKISWPKSKNGGYESILSKHFDFIFSNTEVPWVNFVLSIYSDKSNQPGELSFIVQKNMKSFFDLIVIEYNLSILILEVRNEFSDNLLINFTAFLSFTFTEKVLYPVLDVSIEFT